MASARIAGRTISAMASSVPLGCLILLLSLGIPSHAATAASVEVVSIRDNTLFEDAGGATSDGSGPTMFSGRILQGLLRRALVAFDLTSVLPAQAVLDSAALSLHLSKTNDLTPRLIRVHRVLADWGEGVSISTGGSGAPAEAGDATWLHTFYPNSFWSAPGGDFAAAASESTVVNEVGTYTWRGAGLTADVAAWIQQPSTNHGWILIGEEVVAGTARSFDTRESTTAAFRPRLVLYYSIPTAVESETWGGIKKRYR